MGCPDVMSCNFSARASGHWRKKAFVGNCAIFRGGINFVEPGTGFILRLPVERGDIILSFFALSRYIHAWIGNWNADFDRNQVAFSRAGYPGTTNGNHFALSGDLPGSTVRTGI